MPRLRLALSVLLITLAGAFGWALAPEPQRLARTHQDADAHPWVLPAMPAADPKPWLASIAQHRLWGEAPVAGAAGQAPGTGAAGVEPGGWRLVGVARRGDLAVAIVSAGGGTHILAPGEVLAGGATVLDLGPDGMTVQDAAGPRRIGLYGLKMVPMPDQPTRENKPVRPKSPSAIKLNN